MVRGIEQREFTDLVHRYNGLIFAFIYNLLPQKESVQDLVQDTFEDAWAAVVQQKSPFTTDGWHEDDVRKWLYHVAYCRTISFFRHRKVIQWEQLPQDDTIVSDQSSFEERVLLYDELRQALSQLSPSDVACLVLIIRGFTIEETAAIIGVTPIALRKRYTRAKQRLMALYREQNVSHLEAQNV